MFVNNFLEFILESVKHIVALFGIVNTLAAASACRTFLGSCGRGCVSRSNGHVNRATTYVIINGFLYFVICRCSLRFVSSPFQFGFRFVSILVPFPISFRVVSVLLPRLVRFRFRSVPRSASLPCSISFRLCFC